MKKRLVALVLIFTMLLTPIMEVVADKIASDDMKRLEEVREILDEKWYRPKDLDSDKDKNIVDRFKQDLSKYGIDDIDVSLKSSSNGEWIDKEGNINYYFKNPAVGSIGNYSRSSIVFELKKGEESLETKSYSVPIPWDKERVRDFIREDTLPKLDEDIIKGDNEDLENVIYNLSLPKRPSDYVSVKWEVEGEGLSISDKDQQGSYENIFKPYIGMVKRADRDSRVKLRAIIDFNHEDVTLERDYSINIKGMAGDTSDIDRLEEEFNRGYSLDKLKDFVTKEPIDPDNIKNDIQLIIPRDIDIDNYDDYTFYVESNSPNVVINSYRADVYRPFPGEGKEDVRLRAYMEKKDGSLRVKKDIDIKLAPLTDEEIDREIELMELVKKDYPRAIRGENGSLDRVREDLAYFFEASLGRSGLEYARDVKDMKNTGIIPVALEGWEEDESWRLFRSSDEEVVTHENLLVTRPKKDIVVEIESVLSSQVYGKYSERYPEDERFRKLYRQGVSARIKVLGNGDKEDIVTDTNTGDNGLSFDVVGYKGSIISGEYEVLEGDTVLSFTRRILDDNRIAYIEDHGYIRSIDGQAEMDKGPTSGWVYKVNGKLGDRVSSKYKLKEGDRLSWVYVNSYGDLPTIGDGGASSMDKTKLEIDSIKEEINKENIDYLEIENRLAHLLTNNLGSSEDLLDEIVKLYVELSKKIYDSKEETRPRKIKVRLLKDGDIFIPSEFKGVLLENKVDLLEIEEGDLKIYMDTSKLYDNMLIESDRDSFININFYSNNSPIDKLESSIKLELALGDLNNRDRLRVRTEDGTILGGMYNKSRNSLVFRTKVLGRFLVEEGSFHYKDIEGHWSKENIEKLSSSGLVKFKEDEFLPDRDITRGEFVSLVNGIMEFERVGERNYFKDIDRESPHMDDINILASLGIVNGKDGDRFYPDEDISREEAAVIFGRILEMKGYRDKNYKALNHLKDKSNLSSWSREYMPVLFNNQILLGDSSGMIRPKDNLTRGEAATMAVRFFELILFY